MKEIIRSWRETNRNITALAHYLLSTFFTVCMALTGLHRLARALYPAAVCYFVLAAITLIVLQYIIKISKTDDIGRINILSFPMITSYFIFGFTVLFFLDGGLSGGSHLYFLLAFISTPILLKVKPSLWMMALEAFAFVTDIVLSILFPASVNTAAYRDADMLLPFFFTIVIATFMILLYTYAYHRQKELLVIATEDARAAVDAKATFLENMSREIRTPMSEVLRLIEMIAHEAVRPEVVGYAEKSRASVQQLLSVINDILDYSRLEDHKTEITPVRYDLSSLINDMVNIAAEAAGRKSIDFNIYADHDIPKILYGDEYHIRQVILNILNNAVKYTERGGVNLRIGYDRIDETHISLRIAVVDTGVGIREEDLDRIFVPFEGIDHREDAQAVGTGLGLSIVKRLLDLMDSELEIHSVYGVGTTFSFALTQQVEEWEPLGDYTRAYHDAALGAFSGLDFTAPDAEILVVDDTPVNLVVFTNLLSDTGMQIDTASGGEEMLRLAAQKKYDLIFLDHRMPGMDGVEAFHALRDMKEENPNLKTPVIALTANAVTGARQLYIEEGFTDYLSKPVNALRLAQVVQKYLPEEKVVTETERETGESWGTGTMTHFSPHGEQPSLSVEKRVIVPVPADSDDKKLPLEGKLSAKLTDEVSSLPGIDRTAAITNCGSEKTFEKALKVFYDTLDERADEIERYEAGGDIKNYTIAVHALKSASRLVGALQLSADALHLEECGNRGDVDEIRDKTPALLRDFRAYKEHLAPFYASTEEEADKPLMSTEELAEFYDAVREVAQGFDLDAIDAMIEEAEHYRLPAEESERFRKLKNAVLAADWGAIETVIR